MAEKLKARGHAGQWWAKIDGKKIPCVHNYWRKGRQYDDDGLYTNNPKHVDFVEEIRLLGRVILCDSILKEKLARGGKFRRRGYIALWTVKNIQFDDAGFRFEFDEELAEVELG
jgi:hypothetical protein